MYKTQTVAAQQALIRIIESELSTTEQVLEATRQLIAFKRIKPKTRTRRRMQVIDAPVLTVLGSR